MNPDIFLAGAILVKAGMGVPSKLKEDDLEDLPMDIESLDIVNQVGAYAAFGLQLYLLHGVDPALTPYESREKVQVLLNTFEEDISWFREFEMVADRTLDDPDKINDSTADMIDAMFHFGWAISLGLIAAMDIDPETVSLQTIMEQLDAEIADADNAPIRKLN